MHKTSKEILVGTWVQVSLDTVSSDGSRRPLYGENAKGMIIYTSDGYFTLMQASIDLPKLQSGLPSKATPEEAKASSPTPSPILAGTRWTKPAWYLVSTFRPAPSQIKPEILPRSATSLF